MNYIDSLLNENNNSTTNSNSISLPEADPLLKQMQEDAEQRYYNQLSGSTYSSEPKRLSLDEIAAKKEARLAKKRDELIEDDSNFTLKAKSFYNTVNNLWDGEDLKANYMGKTHSMSNKIFEDVDATMEESQIRRQELIDQYNTAEDNPNAKHKVYQLRLKEGFDQNGNPIYSYKTGIAETSAAERYKNQYIRDGYEILSEKGFAGAEEWENRWHGLKSNLADRTYDEGINSQGQKIKDLSGIGEGYSEVYNTQSFDFGKTKQEIAQNMANSQNLSDIKAERLREGYGRGSDSIVDAIQAGGLKTLADTGDMILDFVTPGDNTLLNDAKDQTKIDKYVGYNRKTADRAIGEATEYFKNGNYAKAAWEIYKEPQIIAESIPAMAEMLLGFGKFTTAGRLAMGVNAANKAGDVAAASKLTKELAENVSNSQKAMYRVAQNAGLLTFAASQTNNQIEERVKNNQQAGVTGGDSIGEVATVFASNLALYGLDRGLFTKITGIGGGKAALSDAFGFSTAETKKSIMKNIANKALAASIAGGAEGGQEYFQTWGEIINEQLGTGANGGKGFLEIIKDSKNIDESIGGLLAGTVGGVQMRQASDTAYTIADKALGISAGKEYVEKANEREKYTFTSGSNWFDEPLKNMSDPTYDEAVKFNTDIARTRGEIKNTSMDKVANAIFGKDQISDINGNSIMPEDAISNSIDTLRSLHFTENAYNTRIDKKDLEDALLIENEVEKQEKISDIEFRKKARKLGGLNEYSNDMIDTFSNLYQKISDPKRNQNPENVAKAQELITQKFLNKINQEQDEEIKNVLLSKFTNELISDLVEKTIKANSSDSEVKNKSFGSQPDNLLFSENGDVYIQGLKDIQKKVFGSQMDPNAPLNPIANELNNKIQLFQKEYEEYKRRLANAPTEEERNKIIRAKNAADVTRETVDGAGFIMDITKPNKKSIFGHMNAISKNISKIDSSTKDSYTQAKSNSLTGMLAPIDQLTEFARKKSRNMDVYNDIMAKYQEAETVEEKLDVARALFEKGKELSDLRETINLNTTTRAEIEALAKSVIPSYRMDLDNIARDKNPNNQPSTGSAMIYESRKFIEALESTKAMLLNKIEGKERLLSSGSLKSIKNAEGLVRKDIDTMKLKIKLIDSTIEQQVQKIDYIANARIVLADPIVSTELARLRNTKENVKTEAKAEAKTEEVKTKVKAEETKTEEAETEAKTEEVPVVENEQEIIRDTNIAEQNVEQNVDQNVEENTTENVEPEMAQEINEINQGEINEDVNGENGTRGRGEENRTEQTGDSETETKNQERQSEDERDGSRSEETSTTREKDSRETSEVTKPEKDKYKKYRNEVIERAEKILSDNPGMTISKATEIAISDIVEVNYEDSNYSFDDEYASNADIEYKEIDDEIKSLRRELFEVENAEKSIDSAKEKKSKIEESKQRAIDVAKRIFARRKIIEERLNDLQEEISKDEARLKELELQHSDNFKMSQNEKKIVSKVIEKENKKSTAEKSTETISKIGKSVELKNKKIAEIDSKIEMLEKINSNENIKDKRKSEINQRIRELNYRKEKMKYNLSENQDNDITLALKEYNQTMDKLDQAEVGSREYSELSLASKTSYRRYLNEKTIDKEIRKNIIESLDLRIEKDKSPFKEENKEIIEKAIEDVKNYNIYQDLAKNKYTILGYTQKDGKKEPIDRPLVLKGDIPQYLVDYSNMDNSSKGYIKLKLSKKQFSERLRDGILKSDDETTIESKVLENYYKMKGNSYNERINMLYPTDRELKSFESVLLSQLAFVFKAKTIDTDATFMKPVSLSPENFKEVNGKPELSEDAKAFNSKYKNELDNPSISIENGQIVAKIKDENGNDIVLDNNMYDINTLALIFGTKEKNAFGTTANFVTVPDYAEEIMRTELIKELGNMYSVQYIDPDQNDGVDFNNIWGVDPLDDRAEDLRYFIKDTFADKGYIPASVIIKSLGEKIYKSLPMSFDKANIEKDAEAKIANQLAIYALSAVSRKNGLGLSIYTSQEDLDSTELIQGKINDTMTANIPVATTFNEATGEEKTTVSKLNLIRLNQDKAKDFIALSSILEYTDPSREGTMPSDKPIETTSDTIKNKTTPKSELAKETILDYQSVGYRIEKNIKELYDLWKNEKTRNFAYQIAGILNPDAKLNAREYRKKLSKNKNERIQFDVLMRFFEEKVNDKEFYIKWDMIASGRYMEDSRITPQNNKITRFLLSTPGTRTNIEFTKDDEGNVIVEPEIVEMMKRSVAQALDYDLDKDLDTFVLAELEKDISIQNDGSLEFKDTDKGIVIKEAIEVFKKSLVDAEYELTDEDKMKLSKLTSSNKDSFHAYQAVRELAKFDSERENFISGSESKYNYDAHMVIEADGITSGMMIILSQMMTKDAQNLFEKGGIYTKEAVKFWTHTAKALGLDDELKILGKNTLSDGSTQQKITHGLLNRIGKIVSKDPSAKEKLRDYWIDKGIKDEKQINELVERANFKDFYNTIAYSVTKEIKSIKDNIAKEKEKLEKIGKDNMKQWQEKRFEALKLQYALIDIVGDEIGRKLAKDPVMVFIYGSSLGSIKNKILNGLIGDSIQNILKNPEKIKEELTRKDGNQSLGIILNAIGIDPYLKDNSIRLDLSNDIKLYDIVNNEGVDNLVVNKSRDISIEEANKILVDSKIMKNLFLTSFETYGKAFEDSFNNNFQFINRYRDILKSIEMVRFEIFDKKFEEKVNALVNKMSYTDSNGNRIEYNPTNAELDNILKELVDEGFGHVIRDINGGYHSFEKTERSNSDRRHSLRTIHNNSDKSSLDSTTANSLGIRQHVSNVGAAPVTSIHNQDGWQIRYATVKENLGVQNIFDALISGLMNHKGAVTKYNEGYSIANSMHSILQSQMKDMENLLNSLTESEKDSIFNNMSNKKAEDIMFVYDKIRNPKDAVDSLKFTGQYESGMSRTKIEDLVHPQIELNISLDRMLVNSKDIIESSAETINDISFGHLYATDLAEQYVGKLGGIKNENVSTETVFNAFFELIATATHKTGRYFKKLERDLSVASYTEAKYVVENKLANNEKEKTRIMKTFDTMINKKVSDNARTEINNIIEKLVNCKP